MLVLTRRAGEKVIIGDDIQLLIISTNKGQAKIGIEASKEIIILREELYHKKEHHLINAPK